MTVLQPGQCDTQHMCTDISSPPASAQHHQDNVSDLLLMTPSCRPMVGVQIKWQATEVSRGTHRPLPSEPAGMPQSAAELPTTHEGIVEFNNMMSSHWSQVMRPFMVFIPIGPVLASATCCCPWSCLSQVCPAGRHAVDAVSSCIHQIHFCNAQAWQCPQVSLVPCSGCGRTFKPEALEHHARACKGAAPASSLPPPASLYPAAAGPVTIESPRGRPTPAGQGRASATSRASAAGTPRLSGGKATPGPGRPPVGLMCYLCGCAGVSCIWYSLHALTSA